MNDTKIFYKRNTKIIESKNQKYTIKVKTNNNNKIYDYLKSRGFTDFLNCKDYNDRYEVYPYIEEKEISNEDKAIDLIYSLSFLHNTTTTYKNIDLDKVKEIYEETKKELEYLYYYYQDLQDYIESKVYMAPAEYLLIRNMSNIYILINFSRHMLEKWYKEISNQKKERQVLLHNNLSLDHFLVGDKNYLISWNKCNKGNVIYDFLKFYQTEYSRLEMSSLFEIYQSKYKYTKSEYFLFLSLLSKPYKVEFKKSNYINTVEVKKLITYLDAVRDFTSKENEKYQEAHHKELQQQNNNV